MGWWLDFERRVLGSLGEERRRQIERRQEMNRKFGRANAGIIIENIGGLFGAVIWLAAIVAVIVFVIVS